MNDRVAASRTEQDAGAGDAKVEDAKIVVVGGSAGGVEALCSLVGRLPSDLAAAIMIVIHIPATRPSSLPGLLAAVGPLPAAHAVQGEPIRAGQIYVAPPDKHLLVEGGAVRLSGGPRENFSRPSIDPLFRSAAHVFGHWAAGVILSGALDDGVAGLQAIGRRGGLTVAQEPREALFPSMPEGAIRRVGVDFVLPAADIGVLLARWAAGEELGGEELGDKGPRWH